MLYTFRMDSYSCGMHRVVWPADVIDPDGERIRHIAPDETADLISARTRGSRVVGLEGVPTDMTSILVQRPTSLMLGQCLHLLRQEGVRVIVDVDDDLETISPRHPTWKMLRQLPGHDVRVIRQACMNANVVVCSTPQIKESLAPYNGVVVRNRLPGHHFAELPDEEFAALNPWTSEPHVAWPVSIGTHPDDGQEVHNSLARLRLPVRVVGPPNPRGKTVLGVEPLYDGEVPFEKWISRLMTIHTGIAPLNSSPFSEAKSALKPLELSVAAVPFVRSRTPEFELLGAGLPAEGKREWYSQLQRLTSDEVFRQEEIHRNLAIAQANRYDLDEVRAEWEHAWFDAYD